MSNWNPRLTDETLRLLREAEARARKEAVDWIGRELVWDIDPTSMYGNNTKNFKGRKCIVKHAFHEEDGRILVVVKTANKKGDGFVGDNDSFHRLYRGLENFTWPSK